MKIATKIQMVDLKSQYLKIKPEIDEAIQQVINSSVFIKGPQVTSFEKALANQIEVDHVIGCANGTDALQIAMMALDLKPGDEVITTTFSFIATVETIGLLGLKPILVDVDPNTFNIDASALEEVITPATKAIIPVHLFGQCADMEPIMHFAEEHDLYVIEDTAQAISAEYIFSGGQTRKAGSIGHIGCTSFFPSKNLGAYGDGGALFTNDSILAHKLRSIINHGSEVKYYHTRLGVNSRLDTLQAAILGVKLKYLNDYSLARKQAADYYDQIIKGIDEISIPYRDPKSSHVFHQYTLTVNPRYRDELKSALTAKGIPSMVYYPVPMHLQEAFTNLGYQEGDFPVAERLCKSVLSLPMHTELTRDQQDYIAENINQILKVC